MNPWMTTALAGLVIIGAYRHGVSVTHTHWQARWAQHSADTEAERAQQERAARTEEQRRQQAANEIAKHARAQLENAALDAADADRAAQRLHNEARQLATLPNCPGDTRAAERSQAATRAAMVLSELLERADQRAGELAAAYDGARVTGLSCESIYSDR